MISASKLSKTANKLVDSCFDASGSVQEKRVATLVTSITQMQPSQRVPILRAFYRTLKNRFAEHTLHIEAPVAIDADTQKRIATLIDSQRRVLDVETVQDTALLGGIRLRIGDLVFDTSLKAKLQALVRGE